MTAIERGQRELDERAGHFHGNGSALAKPIRFKFLTAAELIDQPPVLWRVLRVIPKRGLIVLWGLSGSGKTFIAFDLAAAIVRGIPWAGRRTKRSKVVYIATEGTLQSRAAAYLKYHEIGVEELAGLHVLPCGISLLQEKDVDELVAELRLLQKTVGPIGVILLDTLNRAFAGGDENASEDMGRAIAAAKRIEEALNCAVILIHHGGKDQTRGPRGHSSLKAAADTELLVDRNGDERTVRIEKNRDGADGETVQTFRLQLVDLGPASDFDPDAEPNERVTSCVVVPAAAGADAPKPTKLPKGTELYLRALREVISDRGEIMPPTSAIPPGIKAVTMEAWRQKAYVADPLDNSDQEAKAREKATEARGKRFTRARLALQNANVIGIVNNLVWVYS